MEERLIISMIQCFFVAFGVVVGGSVLGSIGGFFTGEAPLTEMFRLAKGLRIWAIVAAIGGTFDAISNFERGIFEGSTFDVFKQFVIIVSAMGGVQSALLFMEWLVGKEVT